MQSKLRRVNVPLKVARLTILKCLVCGNQTFHRNYGTIICNACATFFRRSIKQNRSNYVCKQNEECRTEHGSKRICMHCRFQKCIAIGINVNFVIARHKPQVLQLSAEDVLYRELVKRFNYVFTQRAYAQKTLVSTMETTETSLWYQLYVSNLEKVILKDYLKQTGFLKMLNANEIDTFVGSFLPFWFFIYCTYYTLQNDGHTQNKLYMIDEKAVDVTPDASRCFVERVSIPGLQNIDVVSTKTHDVHLTWMNGAKNFHENQIQLHDFAIICHILVLRLAIEMFPQRSEPREQLNRLFRSIRQSVDENDENAEIRMGNMLLLINDVMRAVNEAHEWEIIFTLSFLPQNKEVYCHETSECIEYLKQTVDA